MTTRSQIKDSLAGLLGGHTAEELIFNEVTTGGQNDIERATKLARAMVTSFGMSEKLGPRTFGQKEELVFLGREISEQKDYSDETAKQIDDEVHEIIQHARQVAMDILAKNRSKLVKIAEQLIAQETLESKDLDALFKKSTKKSKEDITTTPTPVPIEPVAETEAATKTFVKSFNIAGMPILVVLFGIGVWFRRVSRKKRIQMMFHK